LATQHPNPYRGLDPYLEEDRAFFFGREQDQEVIAANFYSSSFTVLYGASGVGKTSLLLAGVLPELREDDVPVVVFRNWQPGFEGALKSEILRVTREYSKTSLEIRDNLPFDAFLLECSRTTRRPIFLIFDQFEEYFTYSGQDSRHDEFDAELARAVNRMDGSSSFLLAIRDDGLSGLDQFKGRIPNLLSNLIRVTHLDRDSAERAIRGPLDHINSLLSENEQPFSIESNLVAVILDQVSSGQVSFSDVERGGIPAHVFSTAQVETPFLQLVLSRLWQAEMDQGSRTLRASTFEALGSAKEIVRSHLSGALVKLDRTESEVAARLFRYLVTPTGMKIAHGLQDLADYSEIEISRVESVIKKLAHPDRRILRAVVVAGQSDRYEIFHDVLGPAVLRFALTYRLKQRERIRRLIGWAALVTLIIFLILSGIAGFQTWKSISLRKSAEQFYARVLVERGSNELQTHHMPAAAVLFATALTYHDDLPTRIGIFEARAKGARQLETAGTTLNEGSITQSATGTTQIVGLINGRARLTVGRSSAYVLTAHLDKPVQGVVLSSNGRFVAAWDKEGWVSMWSTSDRQLVRTIKLFSGEVASLAVSSNGRWLAAGCGDNSIRLYDGQTGKLQNLSGHTDLVLTLAFGPTDRLLASAGRDRDVRLWDVGHSKKSRLLGKHEDVVVHVSFNRNGTQIASSAKDLAVRLWRLTNKHIETQRVSAFGNLMLCSSFDSTGDELALGSEDGTVRVWDIARLTELLVLQAGKSGVRSVSFSSEGRNLVAMDREGIVHTWNLTEQRAWRTLRGHGAAVSGVAINQDGTIIATGCQDKMVRLWDGNTTQLKKVLRPQDPKAKDTILWIAFSPNGEYVASSSEEGWVRIYDIHSGNEVKTLPRHANSVWGVVFGPDSKTLATGDSDGRVRLWNIQATAKEPLFTSEKLPGRLLCVAFSDDGHRVATGDRNGNIMLWDRTNPKGRLVLSGHTNAVWGVAFSHDGKVLASGGEDGTVRTWDAHTGKQLYVMRGHIGEVWSVSFGPGRRLISGGIDTTVRMWDASSGSQTMVLRGHMSTVWAVAFSQKGHSIVSGGLDRTARVWDVDALDRYMKTDPKQLQATVQAETGLRVSGFGVIEVPQQQTEARGKRGLSDELPRE
jgi:WD40 repeat protein